MKVGRLLIARMEKTKIEVVEGIVIIKKDVGPDRTGGRISRKAISAIF